MKRLITIFVSSIIGISLWGQKLPVTILGDVYIASTGQMDSEGAVHLRAIDGTSVAKVANYGTFVIKDTTIFYSTDLVEGLLMNQSTTANAVSAPLVAVRKNFTVSYSYYQVSFPFDVNWSTGIFDALTGRKLTRGVDFQINFYDGQYRATRGINDSNNWRSLDNMAGGAPTKLSKGVGYEVSVAPGISVVDFFADNTDASNIPGLFARQAKGIPLTFWQCPPASTNPSGTIFLDPENSEGWNAIGGLNSTNFLIKGSTVGYQDPVYYYSDGAKIWMPIYPAATGGLIPDSVNIGTLRPYGVVFVQKLDGNNLTFTYNGDGTGLVLDQDPAYPVMRSSSSADYDLIQLQVNDVKNTGNASRVYFKFNDSYSQSFNSLEGDRVLLDTGSPTFPIVWALAPNINNVRDITYIDCLPYNDNEVPLGMNIPAAGQYNFSLKNVIVTKGITSAVLWDKTTNQNIDMLKSDYTFQANVAVNDTTRFVLFINKTPTAISQVATPDIYAYSENNTITVKNLTSGDKVQILDMTGRIIASGIASNNTYSATVNQKGVYIVNVRGDKTLKVLNK